MTTTWITKKSDKKKKEEKSNKFDTPETREMVRSWLDRKKDTQQREVLNPKKKKTNWITKKKKTSWITKKKKKDYTNQ